MKNNKLFASFLAASLIVGSCHALSFAADTPAVKSDVVVKYEFNDVSALASQPVDGIPTPTVTVETEGEGVNQNKFARITLPQGKYTDKFRIDQMPDVRLQLASAYTMAANADTVISVKMRTNDDSLSTFRRKFLLNAPTTANSSHAAYNTYMLLQMKNTNLGQAYVGGSEPSKPVTNFYTSFEKDRWYTVRIVLHTGADGKPAKISYDILNDQNVSVASINNANIGENSLKGTNKLVYFDFAIRTEEKTLSQGVTWDIDDLIISQYTTAKIDYPEGQNYFLRGAIPIEFSANMDTATLKSGITLKAANGDTVSYTGIYENYIYSITPDSPIDGIATVELDGYKLKTTDGSPVQSKNFSLNYYQEVPQTAPEARNEKIAGAAIVGHELNAVYDYFDLNGDEEEGSDIVWKADDQLVGVGAAYTVREDDVGKLIKCEITPKAAAEPNSGATVTTYTLGPVLASENDLGENKIIADIEANNRNEIDLPISGNSHTYPIVATLKNQLGTSAGLEEVEALWSIDGAYKGVSITPQGVLTVTGDAPRGNLVLEAEATLSDVAVQKYFKKNFTIILSSNRSDTPVIENLKLEGIVSEGAELNLSYDYYQVDGEADNSAIEWQTASRMDGAYSTVQNGGKSYVVSADEKNNFFRVLVVPATQSGKQGKAETSNMVGPQTAPIAKNVKITGNQFIGEVLTGSYEYYDVNGDEEDTATFQWLRHDSEVGVYTEISGATNSTYTLTEDDIDQYIMFKVTPCAKTGTKSDGYFESAPVFGPTKPTATNVNIKRSGNLLVGEYTYNHIHGGGEGNSIYAWYMNGIKVSSTLTCNAVAGKSYVFEVTPVSPKAPYKGETVSATYTVSGGGGGGGGGGAWVGSGIVNAIPNYSNDTLNKVEEEREKENEKNNVQCNDISGHWGEAAIKNVLNKGYLKTDENGNFSPDKNPTRAEVVEGIARALGLADGAYSGMFGDVAENEAYAGKLQALVDAGIISVDINFYPDRNISRQEMCKVIVLAYKQLNNTELNAEESQYADNNDVAEWAKPYVNYAYSKGIMIGVGENRFMPRGTITKAQLATLLDRLTADFGSNK